MKTFGEVNFGDAKLGDVRRTKRLVEVADAIVRHPGGSLPEKLETPKERDGLYHLMQCPAVTHASVLAPHYALTRKKMAEHDGFVVALHDTTELNFSKHESLSDRGQPGNGSQQGWLCHNTLIVDPTRREDAKMRPATDLFSADYVDLLSGWRHGKARPEWTIYDFCLALARLGGHSNRKQDSHPGWITLWRGWTKLQLMLNGARIGNSIQKCA